MDLRRLGKIGSDHFPIFIRLRLDPAEQRVKEPAPLDPEEESQIKETVKDAGPDSP